VDARHKAGHDEKTSAPKKESNPEPPFAVLDALPFAP
jgi:hypothetical protein